MPSPSSTAAPRVSVVIPNWNGLLHLPECLEALAAQTFTSFEVVVVDNASTDGSQEWLRRHHPAVRLIQRPDNGGFSRAVNAGIRATRSEYVALLNNDTAVDPAWLTELVTALDARPGYDLATCKMILYYQPSRLNAAGDVYLIARAVGKNRGLNEPVWRYNTVERVLGACAGAALYRRRLFQEVGLFDEDFFLMSEDTDFNLRCLIAGKRCLYVPTARVRHKYQASITTRPERAMALLASRNEAMVAAKDLPAVLLPLELALTGYRLFRNTVPLRPSKWHRFPQLARRVPSQCAAQLTGARMGLAKRGPVWCRQAISTAEIIAWLRKGSGPA